MIYRSIYCIGFHWSRLQKGFYIVEHMLELFLVPSHLPSDEAQFPKYYSEKDASQPCIYVLTKEELPMLSGF